MWLGAHHMVVSGTSAEARALQTALSQQGLSVVVKPSSLFNPKDTDSMLRRLVHSSHQGTEGLRSGTL